MINTLAVIDLDRTLIYSEAALAVEKQNRASRLVCVELYQNEPLSYMTKRCAALLGELADNATFVPATTRTREQYGRVNLPGGVPKYAICANGGHILVEGKADLDWHAFVQKELTHTCAPLAEIRTHLAKITTPLWLINDQAAEDLFAYLVVNRALLPASWLEELTSWAELRGWTVSMQGRKVYVVPKSLTKRSALAEVVRRTGAQRVFAAGDSLLDAELLATADIAWRPAHGELAETGWSSPTVVELRLTGVAAGEEIVRSMLATLTNEAKPS